MAPSARIATSRWNPSLRKPRKQKKPLNDLGRSLTVFDLDRSWLIAGIVPGVGRQPLTLNVTRQSPAREAVCARKPECRQVPYGDGCCRRRTSSRQWLTR